MGNAWLKFLAEERNSPENKDVHPMKLATEVKHRYPQWKRDNNIADSNNTQNKRQKSRRNKSSRKSRRNKTRRWR
jgi:hypothetical protein